MMLATMMAVTFVGCKDDDDKEGLKITMPSSITYDLDNPGSLTFDVAVTTDDEDLTEVVVYVQLAGSGEYNKETITTFTSKTSWTRTYTAADFPDPEVIKLGKDLALTFCIDAYTKNTTLSKSATIEVVGGVPPIVVTPLVDGADFTLIYKGSSQGDGLNINTTVGLKYSTNGTQGVDGTFEVATTGSLFVELSATEAAAIETKEDLADFYTANVAKGVASFKQVPAKDINKWFISKVGNDCFLIRMNELVFSPGDNQATFSYKY